MDRLRQQGKIEHGLQALEKQPRGSRYLLGDQLTLGDIATACALGYLDFRFSGYRLAQRTPAPAGLRRATVCRPALSKPATALPRPCRSPSPAPLTPVLLATEADGPSQQHRCWRWSRVPVRHWQRGAPLAAV